MVYLTIGAGVAVAVLIGTLLWWHYTDRRQSPAASGTSHGLDPEHLLRRIKVLEEHLDMVVPTVRELGQRIPAIEAEVEATLSKAETRFKTARAAEERARRMAQDVDEDDDEGVGGQMAFEDVLEHVHGGGEDAGTHERSWPDLERLAFQRRRGAR